MTPWARIVAPALVLLVGVGAGCGGNGKDASTGSSTTSTGPSIAHAVLVAQTTLPIVLPDSQVDRLVRDLCTATGGSTTTVVDELLALPTNGPGDVAGTITALGKGAEVYCPTGVAKAPNLLHDLFDAVTLAAVTSTTTTVAPGATTTTSPADTTTAGRTDTVTATAPCSPVGTTGVTSTGYPMTCSSQSCAGDPYDQPRWRATNC
jgi:hypothetical protein